jgi:hypothetical protein
MKSTIIQVRLNDEELAMIDRVRQSNERGELTRSELVRLLLHREFHRRTSGRSVVSTNAISGEMRTGRPKKVEA